MVRENVIIREKRNAYSLRTGKRYYRHLYTDAAIEIAAIIHDRYPLVSFTILELFQLNHFANRLIGRNIIYVYAERIALESVFEMLKQCNPGRLLLNPADDMFDTYWRNDMIVVLLLRRLRQTRWCSGMNA